MRHSPRGLREGTARQPEPVRPDDLIRSAPTEPQAFLLWGAQREDRRFELSRARVTRDMISTSRRHTIVCIDIVGELHRRVDRKVLQIGAAFMASQMRQRMSGPC